MIILIGYECSGVVRDAFRALGHDAYSCDIEPSNDNSHHLQCDVWDAALRDPWDMFIGHPVCKFVCGSGIHWNNRGRGWEETEKAVENFRRLLALPIGKICLENPVGILSTRIRKPDQIIQPYQFGENASKATCLWLKGLPPLQPTKYVEPRMVNGKKRWDNQTDSGQNKLGPSNHRAADRARTYPGIALAMAVHWGNLK